MLKVGIAGASVKIICLLMICASFFLVALPAIASAGSTVHGEVYNWATFETMNNVVVEVYSLPGPTFIERTVVKSGSYSFDLPSGTYLISAKTGTPGTLSELLVTENVTIEDSGDYTIDLILFPPTGLEDLEAMNESEFNSTVPGQVTGPTVSPQPGLSGDLAYLAAGSVIVIVVLAGAIYLYWSRSRKTTAVKATPPKDVATATVPEAPEVSAEHKETTAQHAEVQINKDRPQQPMPVYDPMLPPDCKDVLTILEKNGGRITQLELRKLLPYSEAKVSLIVTDLENRGLIKKIKKGRGNILLLNKPGEQPPEK